MTPLRTVFDIAQTHGVDHAFLNFGHHAMKEINFARTCEVVGSRVSEWSRRTHTAVTFVVHPTQHFQGGTGDYTGSPKGSCSCSNKLLRHQTVHLSNAVIASFAASHHHDMVDYWEQTNKFCDKHTNKGDCTHYWLSLEVHAPAIQEIVSVLVKDGNRLASEASRIGSHKTWNPFR